MDWSTILTTVNPESLTFLTIRVLVNHLPHLEDQVSKTWTENGQRYLTSNNQSAHSVLRVTESYGEEKMMDFDPDDEDSEILPFDRDHADSIMNIFTSRFIHSDTLRFPPSRCIPTPSHLKDHLTYHGQYLTELSLLHCYSYDSELRGGDDVLEIIARGCSSNLKRLALPDTSRTLCITERGVKALATESEFAHTLLELRINGSYFLTTAVLTNMLRCFPSLVKLSLSNVKVICGDQILPFPLDNSLSRLEMLYMDKFHECYDTRDCFVCGADHEYGFQDERRSQKLTLEWIQFFEYYPRLKTIQVFHTYFTRNDNQFIQALMEGLQTRNASPLEYVGLDTYDDDGTDGPSVIRMNALKVTGNAKMEDLHFSLERALESGVSEEALFCWVWYRLYRSWERSPKDLKTCRVVLLIINRLIPDYMYLETFFQFCVETLFFMLTDPRLCKNELGLTPFVIERVLLTLTTGGYDNSICHLYICRIFDLYRDVFCIDIFERALDSIAHRGYYKEQQAYMLELSNSCNYQQFLAIKKVLGCDYSYMRESLEPVFHYPSDIDTFIENLMEREKFFVQQRVGAEAARS